jgi:hypothetical protein
MAVQLPYCVAWRSARGLGFVRELNAVLLTGGEFVPASSRSWRRRHHGALLGMALLGGSGRRRSPNSHRDADGRASVCVLHVGFHGVAKGVVDCDRNVLHNVVRYTHALRISTEDHLSLLRAPPPSCRSDGSTRRRRDFPAGVVLVTSDAEAVVRDPLLEPGASSCWPRGSPRNRTCRRQTLT